MRPTVAASRHATALGGLTAIVLVAAVVAALVRAVEGEDAATTEAVDDRATTSTPLSTSTAPATSEVTEVSAPDDSASPSGVAAPGATPSSSVEVRRDADPPTSSTTLPPPIEAEFAWAAGYEGHVWVVISAPDPAPRTVVLRWGPYQRTVTHQGTAPRTYLFYKWADPRGSDPVPVTVRVEPGAAVEFGGGQPPADAVDINDGWVEVG